MKNNKNKMNNIEIDSLEKDNIVFNKKDEIYKEMFSNKLINEVGLEIKNTLNKKTSTYQRIKIKVQRIIRLILHVL